MQLFDRVVELKVGETEIKGLDMAFEIEKDLTPEPNPCHIEIYNLSAKNREILSKSNYTPVLLKAGYAENVGLIFSGDMISCTHTKEGPDWKTVLATGDGAAAIQTKRINKTFAKGTPVKTVIEEIAKQLDLPGASALSQLKTLSQKLTRGFTAGGNPMDQLSRLLDQHGYNASIQNKALQIIKHGEKPKNKTLNLTAASGLKGTPDISSDKTVNIQAVLMPELLPGKTIHIESTEFEGFVSIQKVRFVGANFGVEWETKFRAGQD